MEDAKRNSIKTLTRIYYDYQRERISLDGRLGMTKDGEKKKRAPERDMLILAVIKKHRDDVLAMEEVTMHGTKEDRSTALTTIVHEHPLWNSFLVHVKGCGEGMAAVIISEFDIHKAPTVSNLWSFAGLNPGMVRGKKLVKGKIVATDEMVRGDKKTKGFFCPFNQFLRSRLCGVLGPGFLKANSPYREYYDNMRTRLEAKDWGMDAKNPSDKKHPKKFHQHRAANRYMVKMFLRDLYVAWRTLEGLEVREPYQIEYLGKKHDAA